jgi:hypothetical protein
MAGEVGVENLSADGRFWDIDLVKCVAAGAGQG